MKALILATLVAALAPVAAATEVPCATTETGCEKTVMVKVVGAGDQAAQNMHVVTVGGEGAVHAAGCATGNVMVVETDADAGDEKEIKIITRIGRAVDENRGWLGVILVESDDEAAEDDEGVVVLNVVKNSPAEQAGLLENDLITHLNGEAVEGGVAALGKAIGELGPGGVADLTIVRDGRSINLSATLSTPQHEFEWTHTPNMHFKDYTRLHPRCLKLTPGGNLQVFSLDDLKELEDLPGTIAEALGQLNAKVEITLDDGQRTFQIQTIRDGNVIEISQTGDGPIAVTRSTEGDDEQAVTEYDTPEALEADDPEAFELFERSQAHTIIIHGDDDNNLDIDFDVDMDDLITDDIRKRIEIHLQDAEGQIEDTHKIIEDAMRRIPNLDFSGGMPGLTKVVVEKAQVKQSFKVNPDGEIELTLRRGDTEVVRVFRDEADLEHRDPEACERYQALMQAPVDD